MQQLVAYLLLRAVNEENASGARIFTAPTNGAAGIIPAVLNFYTRFTDDVDDDEVVEFFFSAAAIGILFKLGASISGAEVGLPGRIGIGLLDGRGRPVRRARRQPGAGRERR